MHFVKNLCGEGKLGDNVLLFGVAKEGIVFGGNIHAIIGLDIAPIVFDMQAVIPQGRAMNAVGGTVCYR